MATSRPLTTFVDKISGFTATYNRFEAHPYRWTYTGDSLAPDGSRTGADRHYDDVMRQALRVRISRWFSPGLLLLAAGAFLMPFVNVSCAAPTGYGSGGGGVTAAYSGIALATGGDATADPSNRATDPAATASENHADWQPLVALGLLLTVAMLVVAFVVKTHPRAQLLLIGSILAALSTLFGALLFQSHLSAAVTAKLSQVHPADLAKAKDPLVTLGGGPAAVCALLAVVAILNGLAATREREAPSAET